MQHVANQLKSRGTHAAGLIHAERDVENGFVAMNGLRNHQLLVLAPFELRGRCGGNGAGNGRRRRGCLQQLTNQKAQRIHTGRFFVALVSGKHRFERVHGHQNDFGKFRAMRLAHLLGQHIFKFVSDFTQLGKSAGRGIAFERVHHAANATDDFFISGTSFKFQSSLVERLQELVGGLEEESAQLGVTILGCKTQLFTSSRWYAVPLFSCTMRNFLVNPKRLSAWPTKR